MVRKKVCTKCKEERGVEKFGKLAKSSDGLNYRCKECAKIAGREYYYRNHEKVLAKARERDRNYRKSGKRKAYLRNYQRKWIAKKKREFFEDKVCERCDRTDNIGLFSKREGKTINQLKPWYEKVERQEYLILCGLCWGKESSARISEKIKWHWKNGTYNHIPALLLEYALSVKIVEDNIGASDVMEEMADKEGYSLLHHIYEITKSFPDIIRDDMCQEMVVDVLDGTITKDELKNNINKYRSKAYKKYAPKYAELSLNKSKEDDRPLEEVVSKDKWEYHRRK